MHLVGIKNDVFDIARRVAEFDPALRVYWNCGYSRFEVHDMRAKGSTYVMSADRLDSRVIARLRRISLENRTASDILRDLEEDERRRGIRSRAGIASLAAGMASDLRFAGNVVSGYGGSG